MDAKNEMSRTQLFWKQEAQIHADARSRIACYWKSDEEPRWPRGVGNGFAGPVNGRAKPVPGIAESRKEEAKGKTICTAGRRDGRVDFAASASDIPRTVLISWPDDA